MQGYSTNSYGDRMVDVYDDWYAHVSDVPSTVQAIVGLAPGGRVLELGVGTGRLAIPLAQAGLDVTGIDASAAMLEAMSVKPGGDLVHPVLGDMAGPLPAGPFDVVLVAFNTFFGLLSAAEQRRAFHSVAGVLAVDGIFALELFVPVAPTQRSSVEVRTLTSDRVVLNVSMFSPEQQLAEGQFIEFTESGGVRLRPWAVRYCDPKELDSMAGDAGLRLLQRWQDFDRTAFSDQSTRHVSLYGK